MNISLAGRRALVTGTTVNSGSGTGVACAA